MLACPDSLPWPRPDTDPCSPSGKAWLGSELRVHQADESTWVASLPLPTSPHLAQRFPSLICCSLPPPLRNTTSPPSSSGNDCPGMAFKTPNCIKYKGCSKPHLQQGLLPFGLGAQQSVRQPFNHCWRCCAATLWRGTRLE